MEVKEGFRPASSGWGQIFSRSWVEEDSEPRAVIVIAHGMAEHSGRYDHFARFLAENGFAVYMNLLERLEGTESEFDADVLLLYDGVTPAPAVLQEAERCRRGGQSVRVERQKPEGLSFRTVRKMG